VFTTLADGTGLVWDLTTPVRERPVPADEKQLTAWWADLQSDDPKRAYAAVWQLSDATPDTVVAFLGKQLRPEAPPDAGNLRQLIADLNSDNFRIREKADKELLKMGHAAAPALRKALETVAPEAARRIEQLLARKPDLGSRPEQLRRLRAMQVLERMDSETARRMLVDLAAGLPLAAETKEAMAACARRAP
jgi:hypothetical protein